MYPQHNVNRLANAILDDHRRARRKPDAWSEASATLFRPPWHNLSWHGIGRKLAGWLRIHRTSQPDQPVANSQAVPQNQSQTT